MSEFKSSAPDGATHGGMSVFASPHAQDTRSLPSVGWRHRFLGGFRRLFKGEARPPWYDARGVAIGLAIGIGAPLGLQTAILALTRLALRFNPVIAFAFTCVNNPLTLAPMYYGHYLIGSAALGLPATLDRAAFLAALAPVTNGAGIFEALGAILSVGGDIALRWAVGAMIVSAICAIPAYFVTYWALSRRRGLTASIPSEASISPVSGSRQEER